MSERDPGGREWERGWDGHDLAQMRRLAQLPLAEKLRWLEEAQRLVRAIEESRRRGQSAKDAAEPRG